MRAPSSSCPSSSSSPHPHRLLLLLSQGSHRHPPCILSTPSSTHIFVFPQSPPAPVPFSSAPSHGLLHGCTKGREGVCVKGQKQCQGVEKEEKEEEEVKILPSPTDFPRSSLKGRLVAVGYGFGWPCEPIGSVVRLGLRSVNDGRGLGQREQDIDNGITGSTSTLALTNTMKWNQDSWAVSVLFGCIVWPIGAWFALSS